MTEPEPSALTRVREVIERLLDPVDGCPWDLKQTPESVRLYILEETYELIDEIEAGQAEGVMEELGDCLFLLVFLARLFEAKGDFNLDQALERAAAKMVSRHPHVFKDGARLESPDQVREAWHKIKQTEKKRESLLSGIPGALPALLRAHRLTARAAKVGFDWNTAADVLKTLDEELAELTRALDQADREGAAHELGDVLFTLANLARHLKINAEDALRRTNTRFEKRFGYMEEKCADLESLSLAEKDRLWDEAKKLGY